MPPDDTVEALTTAIRAGDRSALARAITLAESTRDDHRRDAVALTDQLVDRTGGAIRVGISGPPGVGKSSLVEALGLAVVAAGHRLAVLAVDPTSPRTGGSVLGDKTRMEQLGRSEQAFIRPSPSGSTAGGVARRTRESMLLCEAAGYDVVFVETVGSGQSDVVVGDLVDVFVLLVQPSSGDELQGIKRGVMELADVVVVTKADGDLVDAATRSVADHRAALELLQPHRTPPVVPCSAHTGEGIDVVWETILAARADLDDRGALTDRRERQAIHWLWADVEDGLRRHLLDTSTVRDLAAEVEADVRAGRTGSAAGAQRLLEALER
ncbi:MAG: methylmalonyl Co-A mutase-associated GTPase MeaB [Actinomycetota bacterium]